jgi:predicted TIM-barrel fold metal-dependent hydrolase
MNRRSLLQTLAASIPLAAKAATPGAAESSATPKDLPLREYQPKSMLHTTVTNIDRARYPLIDFHSHLTWSGELKNIDRTTLNGNVNDFLGVMDRRNIRMMVNLTGGYDNGLKHAIELLSTPHPDRFAVFTEPWWPGIEQPNFPQMQADKIEKAHQAGAKGIKVLKTLGLFLREHVTRGKLVRLDDRRFDPMWETAGSLGMPIAIHTSDPEAFFLPTDRFNERFEELNAHPDWSFHGKDFPSNMELQEARRTVMRRHPKTQFVCLHVADAENLTYVSECLDELSNMHVDIAARIGELGRQPRAARKFFDKYQDRIVFGTDAVPGGYNTPQQIFGDDLYRIYYRFLETEDEYFDYAPAPKPPQGRWCISGIGLPDGILKKVYWENAAQLLKLA